MSPQDEKIKEILLREAYVSAEDIKKAEEYAKTNNTSIISYLFASNLINNTLLGQAVAEAFGVPFSDLSMNPPTEAQVLRIPEEWAKKFWIVLIKDDLHTLTIATANPQQMGLLEALKKLFPYKQINITYAFPKDIESTFIHYRQTLVSRLAHILQSPTSFAPGIIEEIVKEATLNKASDIHFEPQENISLIRFRIDGVLHTVGNIPKPLYENILNRIKVLAHLRIDEHQNPQDGAIRFSKNGLDVDLRISIVPTLDGEKTAIRLLSAYLARGLTLNDLGLSQTNQKLLYESAKKPFGMILVTGPTGSGKTTTLYALIKILNRPEINITTIEDPVEYKIAGVNQIQVNPQTNLTFAKGLKSIIRQDPNIILVGEIRDLETADIAVNASLTGHILLSTFHANDAATAIPRLLDIGVEPFLLSSTLDLIIAQRLVRKICLACKLSHSVTFDTLNSFLPNITGYFQEEPVTLYQGKGCDSCLMTGYKGRTAIFEFLKITPKIADLILKNPTTSQIWQLARQEGCQTLFEDGIDKVKTGITTLTELKRVAKKD